MQAYEIHVCYIILNLSIKLFVLLTKLYYSSPLVNIQFVLDFIGKYSPDEVTLK